LPPHRQALNLAEESTQMVEQTLNQMLRLREAVVAISQPNQRLYQKTGFKTPSL
jgi:hypothetical protein